MARYPYSATNDGTKAQIGTGPLDLKFFQIYNNDDTKYFVQFFDAASANVTLGTTTATFVLVLPNDNGNTLTLEQGYRFQNGCTFAVTTTRNGSTAPTTPADVVAFYGD